MISSIKQANTEFFKLFHNLRIDLGKGLVSIPTRYAKKSSYDYSEADKQSYPVIAIQDYSPTPSDKWFNDMRTYVGAVSEDKLKAFLFRKPILMEFKYDVSIAAKSTTEYYALQDYFSKNFVNAHRFVFDKKYAGEDYVGDIVPFSVRHIDIPRIDGILEKNFEFTLEVWLHAVEPTEVDLIQKVVIDVKSKEL